MTFIELLHSRTSWSWFEVLIAGAQILALLTIPSVLLRRRGQPRAALSWLLALFAIPMLGVIAWWAIGRTSIERRRRRRERSARRFADRHGPPHSQTGTPFDRLLPPRALGDSIFPSTGNRVKLCFDGVEAYPEMLAAMETAKHSLNILFYIWRDDETGRQFRDLAARKAREGVTVRLLVDAWGTPKFRRILFEPLSSSGVRIAAFLPSRLYPLRAPRLNFVNHRKIVTVDHRIAFTGGMNIGNEYASRWRDLMVKVEGPAVRALEHVFLDDWFFATKENVRCITERAPSDAGDVACAVISSGPDREAWIEDAYFVAVTRAEKRVWIVTPYFIPSPPLMQALKTASDRGVDVRILLPSLSDVIIVKWASRSYYPELLGTGVRIYEYKDQMIHAKAFVIDDHLSLVGSANVDARSFRLSFEVGCLFHDASLNARLAEWFDTLAAHSTAMKLDVFEKRSNFQKTLESAAHLLSPLL